MSTYAMSTQEVLAQEVATLGEDLILEVLDFVQFLKSQRAEQVFLREQVAAAHSYRRNHPAEVRTVTAEEWMAATAHYYVLPPHPRHCRHPRR